jgi:glycerol-3-phosphate dehydrogenase subunit B
MPTVDVVVIGAGVAGLTAALAAAESGARVRVLAKGNAATHWGPGGIDVAGTRTATTPRDGIRELAASPAHPYAFLGDDVPATLDWLLPIVAAGGLPYDGTLDTALAPIPTAIGGTRRAAILPDAQAAARAAWAPGERLVVCGFAGYKDFWPAAIAASLAREHVWQGGSRPDTVVPVEVDLPGLAGLHNLNGLVLARRFDDSAWRAAAIDVIARGIEGAAGSGGRVALPAVLGRAEHAAVMAALRGRLPAIPFEVPLVPPSLPGIRLYDALRAAVIGAGGQVQLGETIEAVERDGQRLTAVATTAAARTFTVRTGSVILATGGIAGGGLVAALDGSLREVVLDLPVEAPTADGWFAADALDPAGHPLEAAGIRTDSGLRPIGPDGEPAFENVFVAGALLAGQRGIRERCGDGIAITSGWRAGRSAAAIAGGQPVVAGRSAS